MATERSPYPGVLDTTGLATFWVDVKGERLWVAAQSDLTGPAEDLAAQALWEIEAFALANTAFAESWSPHDVPDDAPDLVRRMAHAAGVARVGPMAAAHGVVAEYVARGLAARSAEVFVRYGSDLYLVGWTDRVVPLIAGRSSISGRIGLKIRKGLMPVAVCASMGAAGRDGGHPCADVAVVLARDGAMADAVATALANRVCSEEDVQRAIDATRAVPGVLGMLAVIGDHLGAWGNIRMTALEG